MKVTYKDFRIGEKIICRQRETIDMDLDGFLFIEENERLIPGEEYEITDLDYHFPDRVCVKLKGPYYYSDEFVPISCFETTAMIRERKLKKLGI